jgi:NADH-quinone oxidoreductase subunit C
MSKLEFHFTPVDQPSAKEATENPHAKSTTFVPEDVQALQDKFGADAQEVFLYANEHTVYVSAARIVEVCRFLKDDLGYKYLADLGGIDMFRDKDRYEVFYNLINLTKGRRLRLKTRVDEGLGSLPSVTSVYRAAGWNERECFDMFGLRFEGHADLRRMYMPEDFEYHPLRKEFPLLGVPGSLPLPPQTPEAGLTLDPFAAAHGSKPIKSYEEASSDLNDA